MMKINLKMVVLITLSALINACGGGVQVSDIGDGITGTGITAGRVTDFGSIYVNGIKFDVDNAVFSRDGLPSTGQSEFSIGEYVVIKGAVDSTGTSGIADEVIFEDVLEGSITKVSNDNITIEILGQVVTTDNLTEFHGFNNLTDLAAGNIVEVSGVKDANDLISATSIKLKEEDFVHGESENELKGTVTSLNTTDKTFNIGNMIIEYQGAEFEDFNESDLSDGQFVEVKSASDINGITLIADKIELKDEYLITEPNSELEIEGIVTRFVSLLDFDINGIPVTTNSETEYHDGLATDIAWNVEIKVKGIVDANGVLVAKEIELED